MQGTQTIIYKFFTLADAEAYAQSKGQTPGALTQAVQNGTLPSTVADAINTTYVNELDLDQWLGGS